VLNAAVYAVTIPLSWRYRSSAPPRKFLRTRYDIPLRALAAATVVVIVTTASHSIGSFASGMFALFPIVFCSSIVILHPRVGGKATASVMAHAQVALIGLTLAFMAVHYLAEPLGSWWALGIGLCVAVAWSGILMAVRRKAR
jgi:FtsH-binding integral membrane protein